MSRLGRDQRLLLRILDDSDGTVTLKDLVDIWCHDCMSSTTSIPRRCVQTLQLHGYVTRSDGPPVVITITDAGKAALAQPVQRQKSCAIPGCRRKATTEVGGPHGRTYRVCAGHVKS